jgi:hypothetical protein
VYLCGSLAHVSFVMSGLVGERFYSEHRPVKLRAAARSRFHRVIAFRFQPISTRSITCAGDQLLLLRRAQIRLQVQRVGSHLACWVSLHILSGCISLEATGNHPREDTA